MKNTRNGREYVKCLIDGCDRYTSSIHNLCIPHYKQRWYLNQVGRDELIVRTSSNRWINMKSGYVMVKVDNVLTYEHRVLAEKALGKKLPEGAIVHHTGAPDDNYGHFKLVICPSQEYHMLLHKRMDDANSQNP